MSSFLAGLTLGSILLSGALVIIVLLFLARPFAMGEDEAKRIDREEVDALLLRKDSLLRDIRELDDDYESAKVAPELYMAARPQLVKQAALVMKQLDEHGYVERGAAPVHELAGDIDAQIEAAVRRARTPEQLDQQMEAAIRQARARQAQPTPSTSVAPARGTGATLFCPQCGRRVEPDDHFCPQCGRNLVEDQHPSQAAHA